ncbi:hypothetical protein PHLGIDRAFT_64495 [Phlebiopsis gigantea 11061_1 CR5-6]|uniref:BRCT domain-containing protein n=1 Tax=Phlebiopsis gigantea (strain 11061_1 CR5-6) TaxID=745531 RepID=A0A0C3S513_PHLG1|nr:hypothetical protein PHLGIDRAFT_64495 [Phlebiopsis gigantea 11061_1 CR5-6]
MAHRRQNKSHKVPNVKLRPAHAVPPPAQPPLSASHDSGFDSAHDATQSFVDVCPRPFRGVVLCATGISDKTTLFKQAIELGAQPLNDLTDRVTHLLALESGSAKYKCALENRIPIMHPDWITDCYTVWLRGDDVNLAESIETHRLPIFADVVLCVTGIDDVSQRTDINRHVTEGGGSYVKNIERPVRVTHLLCTTGLDAMSEKMTYAAKFNQRKEASIHMVWEQWFWDSLRLGGRCDESRYDVSKPPPDRPATPARMRLFSPCVRPSDLPAQHAIAPQLQQHVRVRPLSPPRPSLPCRILSLDDEEPAAAKRVVAAVTKDMWSRMLRARGFGLQDGKLTRSPSKSQAPPSGNAPDPPSTDEGRARAQASEDGDEPPQAKPSMLASFRRTQSFAPQSKNASTPKPRQPFGRVPSSAVFAAPPVLLAQGGEELPVASSSKPTADAATHSKIFSGKTFRARGEARCAPVRQAVEESGGQLVSEESDEDVDFVLVRLVSGSKIFREELDTQERLKYRTECWLERCMFEERICPPEDHVSFVPIPVATPVDGTERISLSFSGLDESEACWTRRLARALGMNIAPSFSRRTTHLLCPSREGKKFDKAVEWSIPVVDMQWLENIVRTGVIFLQREASPPREGTLKGKGKAVEAPADPLVDVTNGISPLGDDDYASYFGEPVLLSNSSLADAPPRPAPKPDAGDVLLPETSDPSRELSEPLSLAELREDMLNTTIRSSSSPSPLKLPGSAGAVSPVKIPEEAEEALKAQLSSLLGKRQAASEEDVLPVARQKQRRVRPAKSKVRQSRIPSIGAFSRVNSRTSVTLEEGPVFTGDEDISMLVDAEPRAQEQRVTYFDPEQNDERVRLMRLLESQQKQEWEVALEAGEGGKGGKAASSKKTPVRGTRRSARTSRA